MGGRPLYLWDPVSASSLCLALPVSTAPKSCRVFFESLSHLLFRSSAPGDPNPIGASTPRIGGSVTAPRQGPNTWLSFLRHALIHFPKTVAVITLPSSSLPSVALPLLQEETPVPQAGH